jgi:hypothetical protein
MEVEGGEALVISAHFTAAAAFVYERSLAPFGARLLSYVALMTTVEIVSRTLVRTELSATRRNLVLTHRTSHNS